VPQRQGLRTARPSEQRKRLADLGGVRFARGVVVALVQFERADGQEGLVRGVALAVRVEDLEELLEFGSGGRDVESSEMTVVSFSNDMFRPWVSDGHKGRGGESGGRRRWKAKMEKGRTPWPS
jgi:hypothetical protein